MTTVLRLIGKKFSNASNSAAESILRSILFRFLEEPVLDDTLSLELFQDWTIKLTLKKTFLCVSLVNPFTPFLHFSSIYFSLLKFDAKYNLSKFSLEIERIVLDVDAKMPDKVEAPDQDLEASITCLKETLPQEAKKSSSLSDFILNCMKECNLQIKHFATSIRVRSDLKPCCILFNDLNVHVKDPKNIAGNISLNNLTFAIGEKLNQKSIIKVNDISLKMKDKKASLGISLIDISIDKETVDIISVFLSYIPQRFESIKNQQKSDQNQTNQNNDIITAFDVIIGTMKLHINGICLQMHDFSFSFDNLGFRVSFSGITGTNDNNQFIDFGSTNYTFTFQKEGTKFASFADFPRKLENALQYNFASKKGRTNESQISLGSLTVSLTESLMASIGEIISWANPLIDVIQTFQKPKIEQQLITKHPITSYLFKVQFPLIAISILGYNLTIKDIDFAFMISSKDKWKIYRSLGKIHSITMSSPICPDFNIIQNTINQILPDFFLFYSFQYRTVIGMNPSIEGNLLLDSLLFRIPVDFIFIQDFIKLFSLIGPSKEVKQTHEVVSQSPSNRISIDFDVFIYNIFADYMTINMPSRVFVVLPTIKCLVKGDISDKIELGVDLNPEVYLTNSRKEFSLDYVKSPFPATALGFAELMKSKLFCNIVFCTNTKKITVTITKSFINGGLCSDSLKLLIALITHIQYCLDLPPERQVKTKKFDPPAQLLEIEDTIKESLLQSLNLPNISRDNKRTEKDINELMRKSVTFESIDALTANSTSVHGESQEEKSLFDDLPDATITSPYDDQQPREDNITLLIKLDDIDISFKLLAGKDLDSLYDLSPMKQYPRILEPVHQSYSDLNQHVPNQQHHRSVALSTSTSFSSQRNSSIELCDDDFEILALRDESKHFNIKAHLINSTIALFDSDPSPIGIQIKLSFNEFKIEDRITSSPAAILMSIDHFNKTEDDDDLCAGKEIDHHSDTEERNEIECEIDILNTSKERLEMSIKCSLPDIVVFITQEQVDFLLSFASVTTPDFPSNFIVDEPFAFQYFELNPSNVKIFAHFRFWLDVHIDDVNIKVPSCHLFACKGGDGLAGDLAEFYMDELLRPGAAAVVSGLPVIKNFRRITDAVKNVFTFDAKKYGFGYGSLRSFCALLQIVAMETMNFGANAATFGERFLTIALDTLSGKEIVKPASPDFSLATLIISQNLKTIQTPVKNAIGIIPTIVLAPGLLSFQKLKELFKSMRDKISPTYKKKEVYMKPH